MSKLFEEIHQGLKEAIEIKNGNIPLVKREGMPTKTFLVEESLQEMNETRNNRTEVK